MLSAEHAQANSSVLTALFAAFVIARFRPQAIEKEGILVLLPKTVREPIVGGQPFNRITRRQEIQAGRATSVPFAKRILFGPEATAITTAIDGHPLQGVIGDFIERAKKLG